MSFPRAPLIRFNEIQNCVPAPNQYNIGPVMPSPSICVPVIRRDALRSMQPSTSRSRFPSTPFQPPSRTYFLTSTPMPQRQKDVEVLVTIRQELAKSPLRPRLSSMYMTVASSEETIVRLKTEDRREFMKNGIRQFIHKEFDQLFMSLEASLSIEFQRLRSRIMEELDKNFEEELPEALAKLTIGD